ncbi:co-chaperone GrpE protein [Besnoitia besnoiti]|uniref:Co-chaperone GrpE protein n=1 Tax=Besnoitia besnoiti TaxID=94643 RepID=A0A2A9MLT8_BESBE|nr:co-chaperone GrpE protein [Besnoitia besnoiti]PFH36657.1 co-chaperone GrpE protein [Besnoitia besnoiti]
MAFASFAGASRHLSGSIRSALRGRVAFERSVRATPSASLPAFPLSASSSPLQTRACAAALLQAPMLRNSSLSPLASSSLGSPLVLKAREARALSTRGASPAGAATADTVSTPQGDASRGANGGSGGAADEEEGTVERRKRGVEDEAEQEGGPARQQGDAEAAEAFKALEEKHRQCAEEIDALKKKNRELQDKALRAYADMENARMRHQKEMASLKEYAVTDFAKAMLEVADSMAYATKSLQEAVQSESSFLSANPGAETQEAGDLVSLKERLQQIYDGVKLTENLLHKTLDRFGVEQYDPTGEKFNPALHEALFEMEHPTMSKGEVAQVVQNGYKIRDRILRAAKVGVAKGAPSN